MMLKQTQTKARQHSAGNLTVTPLCDGLLPTALSSLVGMSLVEMQSVLEAGKQESVLIPVNAFLIEANDWIGLIDAGGGTKMGPDLGSLPTELEALGISPDSIDHIFLTHLHPDHANGLIATDGTALFPNADVFLHELEAEFWLRQDLTGTRFEGAMSMARQAVGPYRDRLRVVQEGAVLPGVKLQCYPGHTPGHSIFRIGAGCEELVMCGDIFHIPAIQARYSNVYTVFDVDAAAGVRSRVAFLRELAESSGFLCGSHIESIAEVDDFLSAVR